METNTMKSKLSFAAVGVVFPVAALGFTAVGHLPVFQSRARTAPIRVAKPTDVLPNRVYCFIDMKGEPGRLYRGWICEREHAPTLAN
jgi:hypothetical protein